jgi:tRNA(fMet)-specific endonuclease VapC
VDGQIAAIARVNHLILVTRNIIDFQNFSGIEVENWFTV